MIFEDGETFAEHLIDPLRQTARATAVIGTGMKRQAQRERDALLAGFGIESPPPALKKAAEWGGIALTILGLLYYAKRRGRRRR